MFFTFVELNGIVSNWFREEYKGHIEHENTTRFLPKWLAANFLEFHPHLRHQEYMILDICKLLNEEFKNQRLVS